MAFSSRAFVAALLLAQVAAASIHEETRWPGGKLREALKSHSPFAKHQDHPMKDAPAASAAVAHKSSGVQTAGNAGFIVMMSGSHLRKLEVEAVPGINFLLSQTADNHGGAFTLPEASFNLEGSEVGGITSLSDLLVKSVLIEPSKDAEKHSELHLKVVMGVKAEMELKKDHRVLMSNAQLSTPEASLDLKVRVVGKTAPQIELVSSEVKFKTMKLASDLTQNRELRSFSKDGLLGPFQSEEPTDASQKWLAALGEQIKPRVLKWLNGKLASTSPLLTFPAGVLIKKELKVTPTVLAVNAMQDGGLAIATDVNVGTETCPDSHPEMPLDSRAGEGGALRAFLAVRVLNCMLRHAHSESLLAYKGSTNFVQESVSDKHAVMLIQKFATDAAAQGNPLEKLEVATTSPPRCTSSPADGLVCDLFFTLTLEQGSDRPTFDATAKVGLDLSVIQKDGQAHLDPKVSRCKVDFDLRGDTVTKMGSRMLFKGMAGTLPPMACAIVPQLMKKVPKVHLGPDFLGSSITFEDGYVAVKSDINPFNLKALGGKAEWGNLEGGFLSKKSL